MENNRDVFQLIDLDRTLFNTLLFVEKICEIVDEFQPGLGAAIDLLFEEAAKREESFFALEYMRQVLGRERFEEFEAEAIRRIDTDELRLPGTSNRLALAKTLSDRTPGYGILTYSEYPDDQRLKVEIVGLEAIPMFISPTPDKAELLTSWQMSDGKFQLPEVFGSQIVEELTLEDDKLRAFNHLPEKVTGVWITNYHDATERIAQLGLKNLIAVKHLDESSAYLRNRFIA